MSRPLPRYLPPPDWDTKLHRILTDAVDAPARPARTKLIAHRSAAGDEHRLRGIPCIARGVAGHVPGTRP